MKQRQFRKGLLRLAIVIEIIERCGIEMKKAYTKDVWRTVKKEKKRFMAILLITALGVTMLCGLRAACSDLRYTADAFFDEQQLYDLKVVSTMGLTNEDVETLAALEGINKSEGIYQEVVYVKVADQTGLVQNKTAQVSTLSIQGINQPYICEGRLPEKLNEIAVTSNYLNDSGKKIGDTVCISEDTDDDNINFLITEYVITGIVIDASDVDSHEGTMAFRTTTASDYGFFVLPDSIESEIYTAVYLIVDEAEKLLCYDDVYKTQIEKMITQIDTLVKTDREQARREEIVNKAQSELDEEKEKAWKELDEAQVKIKNARNELNESKNQLEIISAFLPQEELLQMQEQLAQGEIELEQNEEKLADERKKAEKEIADAQKEIDEIELPQWYIQDRSSLSGYTNIQSDSDCIESVGTVFPILFLIVAILISLTTVTRMVEEERGLIGTYKALGFTDREIRRKYIVYALLACFGGGILGDLCGFVVLPAIIFEIFSIMYQLPYYLYDFDYLYGLGGIAIFSAGIVAATWISCETELQHTPALLMRPKAPKSGSRIFMERITFIWKRLSFLNKVTARNLFRYKKRMLMTIGGIMGCTALILCAFVIKDSVMALSEHQYGYVYRFDIMAVTSEAKYEDFLEEIKNRPQTEDYISLRIDNVKVKYQNEELSMQLFVIPQEAQAEFLDYICMENPQGEAIELTQQGAYITQNAGNVLNFTQGDVVEVQNLKLQQKSVLVEQLVCNYMGNMIYMSQNEYESLFGEYKPNGVLMHVSGESDDEIRFVKQLESIDGVQSTMSVAEMTDNFSVSVLIINVVVYIILVMAAGLALVVLFTLATTNISERERELATIKVLGFYDNEVHLYVNKETLILTGIGIILGLPVGKMLGSALTSVLNLPAIYFAVTIQPISYLYAAGLAFTFALLVDCLTDRILNHINPVEALKSVE